MRRHEPGVVWSLRADRRDYVRGRHDDSPWRAHIVHMDPVRVWPTKEKPRPSDLADLAATLRTVLAMCDQPGIVLASGTHLARSIRDVIEGTAP